jgi:hypothetical protein
MDTPTAQGELCYGMNDCGTEGRTNAIGALIGYVIAAVALLTGSVNTDVFGRKYIAT